MPIKSHFISESAFDASGRPLEPAFYTGFPAYHNLIYKIFQMSQYLESQQPDRESGEEGRGEEGVRRSEVPKFWVKRKTLANIISEEVSEVQVSLTLESEVEGKCSAPTVPRCGVSSGPPGLPPLGSCHH